MTYQSPELHEVGIAEDVIQGVTGLGSDMHEQYPPALTLEDFEE
jgi:hypothetical protein